MLRATLERTVRIASLLACAVVLVSFGLFALNQASGASSDAQSSLVGGGDAPMAAGAQPAGPALRGPAVHTAARRAIDGANAALTAPFAALATARSPWSERLLQLLGGLLLYGGGAGALARQIALGAGARPRQPEPRSW